MPTLYEIAVVAPLVTALTYSQPVKRAEPLLAGCCVVVPLGNRQAIGYVLGPALPSTEGEASFVIKPIIEVLTETPFFPASLIPLYRWIARYYHYPIGEVLRTALPLAPNMRGGKQIKAKTQILVSPGPLLQPLLAMWSGQDVASFVLTVQQSLATDALALKKAEQKTLAIFLELWQHNQPRNRQQNGQHSEALGDGVSVPRPMILQQYKEAGPRLTRLATQGILTMQEERLYRDPFDEAPPFHPPPAHLTEEQEQVLAAILPAVDAAVFSPFLLFGVTGCGKTEVYLQAVRHALAVGKTALVLVPEIALAAQLEAHFYSRFGTQLAVLHSGLSDGMRFDQWQMVRSGTAQVVLGARSAVFAPLENLSIIIVDEEHEPAYKQEDGLRYNGRDLAVLRAQMAGCPVLLGSATPSVVSYHHCAQKKYTLLTMCKRVADQALPTVEIVDLSTVKRSRPELAFSDQLITAVQETLDQGKQTLLFVNRRGFSSFMLCRDCGSILQCKHCRVSLTLHRGQKTLLCHYCGYSQRPETLCPTCGSTKMAGLGIGSERIEEEVRQLFPEARVARLDSDTISSRTHYLGILKAMRSRQVDILIGTQMIAKGLHFPHITLVGVVWADSGLGMPDFKAAERTFSLLAQVTGRAGRGEDAGRVIIQTYQPHHYSIYLAQQHDYTTFYEREIATRQPLRYPPFARLVNIRFSGLQEKQVEAAANGVADFVRRHPTSQQIQILGPAPAPLVKIKDRIRWQLLLKSSSTVALSDLCEAVLAEKHTLCSRSVTMSFDVDPENMM